MRTFRSSTFSFRTLDLSDIRGSGAWKAVALTVCLVGGAELVARRAVAPIGSYWEYWTPQAAAKFEGYRAMLRTGRVPRLVIVGDSTAARDIDPAALGTHGNGDAYNLAWPANFPMAFQRSTLPLLQSGPTPHVVIVSFSPSAFTGTGQVKRFEASILSSAYADPGQHRIARLSYLARLRAALPFRRSWWTGRGLPRPALEGFMPLEGIDPAPASGADDGGHFERARFSVVDELIATARARGFDVIVVIPPRLDPSPDRQAVEEDYVRALRAKRYPYVDFREAPFLQRVDFHDASHLNDVGARIYSKELGEAIERTEARLSVTRSDES